MSETGNGPTAPEPAPRSGCLTALMVMVGIVLLLPGLCAVVFSLSSLGDPHFIDFLPVLGVCLLVALGGVMLLRAARRSPKR